MSDDQPTHEEKLRTYRGEDTGWGYWISAPPVPTNLWTDEDWVRFIGRRWYRKTSIAAQDGSRS